MDNSERSARGAAEGQPSEDVDGAATDPQAAAQAWIAGEGLRIVVEHLREPVPRAELLLARWRDQHLDGDAVALMAVVREVVALNYVGATFHNAMTQACARWQRRKLAAGETQGTLPLGGVRRVG